MAHKRKTIPQTPIEVEITGLSHDGRGIARVQDKIVFVFGALPGEKVLAKYTHCYARFDEAMTLEVRQAAKERVTPPCVHFGVCGGCQLQHMSPASQIHHKQTQLKEQLLHQAKVIPKAWLPPLMADTIGYRQKARLGVRYVLKKESLLVGFREQKNNKLAILETCQVLDARVGMKIHALREMIMHLAGRDEIAQIEVAVGQEEVALVFRHLKPLGEADLEALKAFCQKENFSLYLQPGGVETVHKIWPHTPLALSYRLDDQQLTYHFHPCDFTQVNRQMNQQMVNLALDLLKPSQADKILDLFCGLGNFSLPLAQKANKVVGVEGAKVMVERATDNAKQNGLQNLSFYAADLESDFKGAPWAQDDYTQILLDPPRSGALKIVEQISQFTPQKILYISCHPATFVRDAGILVHQQGFHLEKIGVMDMFPHTAHVETIALFCASTQNKEGRCGQN